MNFDKYSQKIIILAAFVWAFLVICAKLNFLTIPLSVLIIFFGLIVCALGLQNLIILNISAKSDVMHPKIKHYDERFGEKYGLIYYVIISVLSYIIFGIVIVVSGFFI